MLIGEVIKKAMLVGLGAQEKAKEFVDELVKAGELSKGEASTLVKREMEEAYQLSVPLRADLGWGPNWAEAVPAGH